MSYDDLVKLVTKHHNPEPSAPVQRFKFHSRCHQPGETVCTYVAELRCIAEHCLLFFLFFFVSLIISKVCCAKGSSVQFKTLEFNGGYWLNLPALDFKRAFELAQAMESADRDAKTLVNNPSTPVHIVQTRKQQQQARRSPTKTDQPCYRCKGKHSPKSCQFKDAECRSCKKKGHIACACMSMPRPQQRMQPNRQ